MILFLALLVLIPAAIIYAGCIRAYGEDSHRYGALFLPTAGISFWIFLMGNGIGSQSMANASELYIVAVAAIGIAFLKFKYIDARARSETKSLSLAVLIMALVVVALRTYMPNLPE